jgi:glutathione S-transferase
MPGTHLHVTGWPVCLVFPNRFMDLRVHIDFDPIDHDAAYSSLYAVSTPNLVPITWFAQSLHGAVMIIVHHLEHSRSLRIPWLLEELGLPYTVQFHARVRSSGLAPESLKRIHPLGKAPIIVDDDRVVAESGAIIEYLLERYAPGKLQPQAGTEAWLDYRYWMHYAEGTLMPLMVMSLVFNRIDRTPWPLGPVARLITRRVRTAYLVPAIALNVRMIEDHLAKSAGFAGADFSAADIQMSIPLESLVADASVHQPLTHGRDWLKRMHGRAAYHRALAAIEQARAATSDHA